MKEYCFIVDLELVIMATVQQQKLVLNKINGKFCGIKLLRISCVAEVTCQTEKHKDQP